jgi:hypothetical protein
LVGLLYFLQPIIRGWARYRGQFTWRKTIAKRGQSLESESLRSGDWPLGQVSYWGNRGVDRIDYIRSILEKLEEDSLPSQTDTGWSDYDLEVLGSRWARLRITTVSEDYPKGARMIRCRLRAVWTLQTKSVLAFVVGVQMLAYGALGRWLPLLILAALSIPVCIWLVNREKRKQQSLMIVLLDEIAKKWGLVRVPFEQDKKSKV